MCHKISIYIDLKKNKKLLVTKVVYYYYDILLTKLIKNSNLSMLNNN